MTLKRTGVLAALLAALVAVAVMAAGSASAAGQPIVIGWAFDSKGAMAPFDGPALAAAQLRVKQVNARGGVKGRPLQIVTCDTQGNKPAIAKACAAKLIGQKADIIFTTCDVDFAAPVVQEAIDAGKLAVAPCIGTDQMGPKRFGAEGQARVLVRQRRAGRGVGDGPVRVGEGLEDRRARDRHRDRLLQGRREGVQGALHAARRQDRRRGELPVARRQQHPERGHAGSTASKADVIVTATAGAFGALPAMIAGLRSLDNNTPVLNSWAGDGTYWVTKDPQVTNYYFVTYASIFGDDPNKAVNALAKQVKAGTGGFITGSAAIDGVVTAINRAGGSTNGVALAAQLEKFKKVPTLSGLVSFSPKLHSVFGRQYRVIKIQDNKAKVVGSVVAKVVPKI